MGAYADPFTLPWADLEVHLETTESSRIIKMNTGNVYGRLINAFSESVRGLHDVPIPADEGLANQQIIEAVYKPRV